MVVIVMMATSGAFALKCLQMDDRLRIVVRHLGLKSESKLLD